MPADFSEEYKTKVFNLWYKNGKPLPQNLYNMIPDSERPYNKKPGRATLSQWVNHDFVDRAKELDEQVELELRARLVNEKVEMLARHAKLGENMQDMGLEYLREHKNEITAPSAVKLIVEGWRIERSSKGIPDMLDKIRDMSEEELVDEIAQLIGRSPQDLGLEDGQ
jgi:hypothetical protein